MQTPPIKAEGIGIVVTLDSKLELCEPCLNRIIRKAIKETFPLEVPSKPNKALKDAVESAKRSGVR